MESTASPSPRSATNHRVMLALAAAAFLLYAALLIVKVNACAGGSDSSGYMNHARLLGMGRLHSLPRELPGLNAAHFSEFLYTPLGFVPQSGSLVPSYPVGMPLMIVAAHWLAGWNYAGDVVIVVHALAALLLLFALSRTLGLNDGASLLATVVLAASPLFLDFSLQAMSDVPALAWTSATALCLWLARRRIGWSVLAGFGFGVSVLVRPNNVLMLLPAVVAWWPRWSASSGRAGAAAGVPAGTQSEPPRVGGNALHLVGRQILGFGLGGLAPAAAFILHSHAAYGHWLTTGYGDASSLFQPPLMGLTLRHYAQWMPVVFSGGVWLFLLLPLLCRRSREAAFLCVWGAAYLGFYVSSYHPHEAWWYLRFVLPAAPAFLLGQIWAARWLWHLAATRAVRRRESNAQNAAARQGRAIYAPLFPFETDSALKERMPGIWTPVGRVREVVIYRWDGIAGKPKRPQAAFHQRAGVMMTLDPLR